MTGKTWNVEKGRAAKITGFSSNFSSAQQTMKYDAVVISSDGVTDGAVGRCRFQESKLFHVFLIFCTTAHTQRAAYGINSHAFLPNVLVTSFDSLFVVAFVSANTTFSHYLHYIYHPLRKNPF
jgi:hypothetical protein